MQAIASMRELRVWQNAMDAAMAIFEASRHFPVEERYSLTDQIRRSSRSVAANISEAWHKRRYPANFVSKLSDAEAEAAETRTWLSFAQRCGYLNTETFEALDERYREIIGQLIKMATQPEKWSPQIKA